nr:hypothetical protein [Tanacetum cinerariifolium]
MKLAEISNVEQAPLILKSVNEENSLVLHALVEKNLEVNTSEKKVTDDEPPVNKLKFLLLTPSSILSPTSLHSILPKPIQKPDATTMSIEQFTEHLSKTTSSIFSPTPPEPTPPTDPTTPKDESKGKALVDQLPIIKISYRVNSFKEATMRITRGNDPLNLTVYERFELKTLEFSEWLEEKALGIPPPPELSTFRASINDKKRKRSLEILKKVFVKEDVVVDRMHRNLVPPLKVEGRKGLVIREPESGVFFFNGNFDLVFQRKEEFYLATAPQLIRLQNGILRGTLEAEEFFKKMELTIEARDDTN